MEANGEASDAVMLVVMGGAVLVALGALVVLAAIAIELAALFGRISPTIPLLCLGIGLLTALLGRYVMHRGRIAINADMGKA